MKARILAAYDPAWLATLEDNVLDFIHITSFDILEYIKEEFLKLTNTEKMEQLRETEIPWNQEEYLSIYFIKIYKEQDPLKKQKCLGRLEKLHKPLTRCTTAAYSIWTTCSTGRTMTMVKNLGSLTGVLHQVVHQAEALKQGQGENARF